MSTLLIWPYLTKSNDVAALISTPSIKTPTLFSVFSPFSATLRSCANGNFRNIGLLVRVLL